MTDMKKSAKKAATDTASGGLTPEERAAVKERAKKHTTLPSLA